MSRSPFQRLSAFFGFEASKTLPELLPMLMSEQEAEILLALPGMPHGLAQKLPHNVDRLMETLEHLYMRGQCVTVCPTRAIAMAAVRDPDHIPAGQPGFSLSRVPVTTKPK